MDFAKLSQNEKLATYGSAAVIIGGLVGLGTAGLGLIAILAAVGMLAVIFLPQMSPATRLPGSKGSLMLGLGAVAAVILVLGLLNVIGALDVLLRFAFVSTLFYVLAVAGGVLMAWAGWREFQAEGGKFQVGSSTAPPSTTATSSTVDSSAPPPAATTDSGANRADPPPPPAPAPPQSTDPDPDRAPRADAPVDRAEDGRPPA